MQKSCTWYQNHAFELLIFQKELIYYRWFMTFWQAPGACKVGVLGLLLMLVPLTSAEWCPVLSGATEVFLVLKAQHWCSNTDSGGCALLIVFCYLPLSAFPAGQWTTKSIWSDLVPDTWRLVAGLYGARGHRGRPGRNFVSRDVYEPIHHRGQMSQP